MSEGETTLLAVGILVGVAFFIFFISPALNAVWVKYMRILDSWVNK